jgi:hypothetical protein
MKIAGNKITTPWGPNGGSLGAIAHAPPWGTYGNSATNNTWADGTNAGQFVFGSGGTTSAPVAPRGLGDR